jgi:hypothetical protein
MKILTREELLALKGGAILPDCALPPPDPPPKGFVWLPPNPDNPTSNTPTTTPN